MVEVGLLNCIYFSLEPGIAKIIYMGNRDYSLAKTHKHHPVRYLVRIRYSQGGFGERPPLPEKSVRYSKGSGRARSVIDCIVISLSRVL